VQRSTARNDETMSGLDFLTRHRATFPANEDAPRCNGKTPSSRYTCPTESWPAGRLANTSITR
jgi:hypothetical protein